MSPLSSFRSIENKYDIYRGKDCMQKFCELLREHAITIINFKKKNMKLLTKSSRNHIKMQKSVIFVKENLKKNILKTKNIVNLGVIVIIQGNIEVLRIVYVM